MTPGSCGHSARSRNWTRYGPGDVAAPKRSPAPYTDSLLKLLDKLNAFCILTASIERLAVSPNHKAHAVGSFTSCCAWGRTSWARPNTTCPPRAGNSCANCLPNHRRGNHPAQIAAKPQINSAMYVRWKRAESGHEALFVRSSTRSLMDRLSRTCSSNTLNPNKSESRCNADKTNKKKSTASKF